MVQRAAETHSHLIYVTASIPIFRTVLLVRIFVSGNGGDDDLLRGDIVVKALDKDASNNTRAIMADTPTI